MSGTTLERNAWGSAKRRLVMFAVLCLVGGSCSGGDGAEATSSASSGSTGPSADVSTDDTAVTEATQPLAEPEGCSSAGVVTRSGRASRQVDLSDIAADGVTVVAVVGGPRVVDRRGDDVLVTDGLEVDLPGEGLDVASGIEDGQMVVLVNTADARLARLFSVSRDGQLSEVALPAGTLGAREIEHLPGAGAVVSLVESVEREGADLVNAWHLDVNGTWSRLTDLSSSAEAPDGRFSIVENLRETGSGVVMGTVFRALPTGDRSAFQSRRLTVMPPGAEVDIGEPLPGELVFDETVEGRELVGTLTPALIEWFDVGAVGSDPIGCEERFPAVYEDDPDL